MSGWAAYEFTIGHWIRRVQESEFDPQTQCPKCGSQLVERVNRAKGTPFIGCSAYPKCDYTQKSKE